MTKKTLKILALAVVACVMCLAFAGCTQDTAVPEVTATPEATATPAITPAEEGGVIIMGTNAAFPPFEFEDGEGLVDGFDGIDVAIAMEIAKDMGKTVTIDNMAFNGLITALSSGKVDFVIAGMTANDERRENVDFSDTYYLAKQVIITKEGTDITSAADLIGKTVGVVATYTGDMIITEFFEDNGAGEPERYPKGADAVLDLLNGRVDAIVIDSAPAEVFITKNPGLVIVEDAEIFETEEYAIAVKKGNTELLEQINATLKRLKDEGKIEEFAKNYQQ